MVAEIDIDFDPNDFRGLHVSQAEKTVARVRECITFIRGVAKLRELTQAEEARQTLNIDGIVRHELDEGSTPNMALLSALTTILYEEKRVIKESRQTKAQGEKE